MTDPSKAEIDFQMTAFAEQIFRSVVLFFCNPNGKGISVGTGFLVTFKGKKYFVSAYHNFGEENDSIQKVIDTWNTAKFKLRDEKPLRFEAALQIPIDGMTIYPGVSLQLATPYDVRIDKEFDLLAVRLEGKEEEFGPAHFIDLPNEAYAEELRKGISLQIVGNPFDVRVKISRGQDALLAYLDHVSYDPEIDISMVDARFKTSEYLFMPYSLHKEGVSPRGFSGAAVFAHSQSEGSPLWTAQSRVIGIVLRYFSRQKMLLCLRIGVLFRLLEGISKIE